MKTVPPYYFPLVITGLMIMAFFGSRIGKLIGGSDDFKQMFMPLYSLGILLIFAANHSVLRSRVKDLEAKIKKLEEKPQ